MTHPQPSDTDLQDFMESHGFYRGSNSISDCWWDETGNHQVADWLALRLYTICQKAEREAEDRGREEAVVKIFSVKTEGLFDNGDLFIKRKPIEDAVVELLGYEKFKAIQESLPPATPPQDTTKQEEQPK